MTKCLRCGEGEVHCHDCGLRYCPCCEECPYCRDDSFEKAATYLAHHEPGRTKDDL